METVLTYFLQVRNLFNY